jgi:hypothetical protein
MTGIRVLPGTEAQVLPSLLAGALLAAVMCIDGKGPDMSTVAHCGDPYYYPFLLMLMSALFLLAMRREIREAGSAGHAGLVFTFRSLATIVAVFSGFMFTAWASAYFFR